MKISLRVLSSVLIVVCLVASFCVPVFAATGNNLDAMSPFAYPEKQKRATYDFGIFNSNGDSLVNFEITIVGMWSQYDHTAYMTDAICELSGPEQALWDYEVVCGSEDITQIYLTKNNSDVFRFTFAIHENGNISGIVYSYDERSYYFIEH